MFFLKKKKSIEGKDKIVFFLHGYGSNAENILSILEFFQGKRPQYHYCALQAPSYWPHDEYGFQWFSLPDIERETIVKGLKASLDSLRLQMDKILSEHNLSPENAIVGGFSQGGMMSLNCLYGQVKYAGLMSYSGGFFEYGKPCQNIPCFLVHGNQDQVVPLTQHLKSIESLKIYNIDYEHSIIEGLEHSIDLEGINKGIDFIDKIFF